MTKDGHEKLGVRIAELRAALEKSMQTSSDRQARANGSSGNGCSIPDDASRQHTLMREHISRLTRQYREVTVLKPPETRETASIGSVITLRYVTHDERHQTKRVRVVYHIVGFNEGEYDSIPRKISYETDIIQTFLGERAGYSTDVHFDGKLRKVHLTAIRFPTDKFVRTLAERTLGKIA